MKIPGHVGIKGRQLWVLPLALGVFFLLAPTLGVGEANLRQWMLVAILALPVSGLNLAWGYAGELAIGQLAAYALGAYITGWMSIEGLDLSVALLASAAAAAALGLLTALPALRVSGWGVAMVSFFLILMISPVVALFPKQTGGQVGLLGIPAPVLFGHQLGGNGLYVLVASCLVIWLVLMRNLVTSRHGSALRVMRESPVLAASLGLNVPRLKITAYALGAIPAGIGGSLFVFVDQFVSPGDFTFDAAILIIAAAVLGGAETVYGAVVGAAILTLLPDRFNAFNQYSDIVYGIFLVAGGVLLTSGRFKGALERLKVRVRMWGVDDHDQGTVARPSVPELARRSVSVEGISKSFGGSHALNDVTLEARPGEITALIGANGSGKTTLLNIISGFYRASDGIVNLDGERLPLGKASQIARRGIARTFQTPVIPTSMTTEEAVEVGRFADDYCGMVSSMLRLPKHRSVVRRDTAAARVWLGATGLRRESRSLAQGLSLGDRRMLEVARALATGASVLLLDEVASGLDPADLERLSDLLRMVRDAGGTILLVEHNFRLVCDLADSIYVLERGQLIAHGSPEAIQKDQAVARSYLGDEFRPADEVATIGSRQDDS